MEPLNSLETEILGVINAHRGRGNAISREDLVSEINGRCPLFPVSERAIRATIKHLVTQHGLAIGSCSAGYFLAETADEIEAVCRYYDSYGLSLLFVSSKLRKIEMKDYLGQLSMKFGIRIPGIQEKRNYEFMNKEARNTGKQNPETRNRRIKICSGMD